MEQICVEDIGMDFDFRTGWGAGHFIVGKGCDCRTGGQEEGIGKGCDRRTGGQEEGIGKVGSMYGLGETPGETPEKLILTNNSLRHCFRRIKASLSRL
jgi:hypothetical protein